MVQFFRNLRQNLLSEGKLGKYLKYAIGEIVLVVIGILIAIQINDWTREKKLLQEETESYQLIVQDLRRDSALIESYYSTYNLYLDTYFNLNNIKKGQGYYSNVVPDFLVSNIEFNPVVQRNHQATIDKLRNKEIRIQINSYFRRLSQAHQATEEFNELIHQESRPFFLVQQDLFLNDVVFDNEDRTFPPFKGASTLDTVKLSKVLDHKSFLPIISELRMSIGFYLTVLEILKKENQSLIEILEKNV